MAGGRACEGEEGVPLDARGGLPSTLSIATNLGGTSVSWDCYRANATAVWAATLLRSCKRGSSPPEPCPRLGATSSLQAGASCSPCSRGTHLVSD